MLKVNTSKKSRICIYIDKWGSGGIESFILNSLENMERNDLEIDIVAAKLGSELYMQRVKALEIGFFILSGSMRKIQKNRAMLKKIMEKRNYSAIHLNLYQAIPLIYLKDAKRAGIPNRIAHSHNTDLRRSAGRHAKLILHNIAKRLYTCYATECFSCSRAAADFMFKKGTDYTYIANGIDAEKFSFSSEGRKKERSKLSLDNHFVIGNVGRLSSQKNQSFLLDILVELKKKCPESVLLLVGEGEDLDRLKARAERLNLKDSVIFYGVTDDIALLYWAMDVFLLPSLFEGLGIVAIEAQAAGLPVICSENVPREAGVTELAEFMPLSSGAEAWAAAIINKRGKQRSNMNTQIEQAGFSANKVACYIKGVYLKGTLCKS